MKYINVAIIGPVSAGKSTLLNTLFVNNFSEMNIRRTTMQPQIYEESHDDCNAQTILEINKQSNQKFYNDKNIIIEPIHHKVDSIKDFLNLDQNVLLRIHDLPGINDNNAEQIYLNYMVDNFHVYDIVFFVIDINSSLNTSTEVNMLNTILQQIAKQKQKYHKNVILYVIVNKYDHPNKEYDEMGEQIRKIFNEHREKHQLSDLKHRIIRLSLETAYIYRMIHLNTGQDLDIKYVNKIGLDNYPKREWFKLDEESKREKIKNLIQENDYNETMQECRFDNFKLFLQEDLTIETQVQLLCNPYKIKIVDAINNCPIFSFKNIGHDVWRCIQSIRHSMDNIMKIFDSFFPNQKNYHELQLNHFIQIINATFNDLMFHSKNYPLYWIGGYTDEIYHDIKKLASCVPESMGLESQELLNLIKQQIVNFYDSKLYDSKLNIQDTMTCISILSTYLEDDTGKYYKKMLTENKHIYDMSAQELVDLNEKVYQLQPTMNMVEIVLEQLKNIYQSIYDQNAIKYFDNIKLSSYLFTVHQFWINKKIAMPNLYDSFEISKMEFKIYKSYVVCAINDDSELTEIDPVLEKYLSEKIEKK